jgi:hypothetical protein
MENAARIELHQGLLLVEKQRKLKTLRGKKNSKNG